MQKAAVAKKVHSSRVRLLYIWRLVTVQSTVSPLHRRQDHRGGEYARHSPHLGICGTGGIIDPGDCIFCAAHFATAFHHSRTDLQG